MRIVYMLTSLGMGGAERQTIALASGMAQRGHEVAAMVLLPRGEDEVREEWPTDLKVVSLGMGKTPWQAVRGLVLGRRFLAEFRPEMVHSNSFHANIASRLMRLMGLTPVVVSTVHNVYEGGWHRMLAYRLTDGLCRRTTAVSQAAANRFIRLKAVPESKCVVIPNAFDTGEFRPERERRAMVRAEMAVADGTFVWLAAGRIAPAKDYPNLLRAFARARASRPDARLWIAGEFSESSMEPLLALATELGLGSSLHWLGLRRDMPVLLDAADGFVQGSAWEGMPLAIGEAMCMEKPIVATDVGGVRELVGDAGIVVAPRDAQALANAMVTVMGQQEKDRQALGCAARLRIERSFRMEKRILEWETIYADALKGRKNL